MYAKPIMKTENLNKPQEQPCNIHGVVCCLECDAMTDEQRWQMEQHLQNEQWESNISNLYTYGDDGFCNGFTNW